jgi:hypothetical protein
MMGLPLLKLPSRDVPILLIHQGDEAVRDALSMSSSNPAQTITAMRVLVRLNEMLDAQMTIRCICLYATQALDIEREVRAAHLEDRMLVTTADATQGHEADFVVVVTTVSSFYEGVEDRGTPFWAEPDRANVGLSRPKHGLVVIGNMNVLNRMPSWSRFLNAAMRLTRVVPPGFLRPEAQEGCEHGEDGVLRWKNPKGQLEGVVRDEDFYKLWEQAQERAGTSRNREGEGAVRYIAHIPGNARGRAGRNERQHQNQHGDGRQGGSAQEEWPELNAGGPGPIRPQMRGRGRGDNGPNRRR